MASTQFWSKRNGSLQLGSSAYSTTSNFKIPYVSSLYNPSRSHTFSMDLTDDILHVVFSSLDQRSLCCAAMVCHQWRSLSRLEEFWKSLTFEGESANQEKVGWLCNRHPNAVEINLIEVPCVDEISREAMYSLQSLEKLNLKRGTLTEYFFNALSAGCLLLQELNITESVLESGSSHEVLVCHENLRQLHIVKCRVVRVKVRCPLLEKLSLKWTTVAAADLRCPRLHCLDMSSCHKLSDAGIRAAVTACSSLIILDLSYCSDVSKETVHEIACACPNLRVVNGVDCPNASLPRIAGFECTLQEPICSNYCAWLTSITLDEHHLPSTSISNCCNFLDLVFLCPALANINISRLRKVKCRMSAPAVQRLLLKKTLLTASMQYSASCQCNSILKVSNKAYTRTNCWALNSHEVGVDLESHGIPFHGWSFDIKPPYLVLLDLNSCDLLPLGFQRLTLPSLDAFNISLFYEGFKVMELMVEINLLSHHSTSVQCSALGQAGSMLLKHVQRSSSKLLTSAASFELFCRLEDCFPLPLIHTNIYGNIDVYGFRWGNRHWGSLLFIFSVEHLFQSSRIHVSGYHIPKQAKRAIRKKTVVLCSGQEECMRFTNTPGWLILVACSNSKVFKKFTSFLVMDASLSSNIEEIQHSLIFWSLPEVDGSNCLPVSWSNIAVSQCFLQEFLFVQMQSSFPSMAPDQHHLTKTSIVNCCKFAGAPYPTSVSKSISRCLKGIDTRISATKIENGGCPVALQEELSVHVEKQLTAKMQCDSHCQLNLAHYDLLSNSISRSFAEPEGFRRIYGCTYCGHEVGVNFISHGIIIYLQSFNVNYLRNVLAPVCQYPKLPSIDTLHIRLFDEGLRAMVGIDFLSQCLTSVCCSSLQQASLMPAKSLNSPSILAHMFLLDLKVSFERSCGFKDLLPLLLSRMNLHANIHLYTLGWENKHWGSPVFLLSMEHFYQLTRKIPASDYHSPDHAQRERRKIWECLTQGGQVGN